MTWYLNLIQSLLIFINLVWFVLVGNESGLWKIFMLLI